MLRAEKLCLEILFGLKSDGCGCARRLAPCRVALLRGFKGDKSLRMTDYNQHWVFTSTPASVDHPLSSIYFFFFFGSLSSGKKKTDPRCSGLTLANLFFFFVCFLFLSFFLLSRPLRSEGKLHLNRSSDASRHVIC